MHGFRCVGVGEPGRQRAERSCRGLRHGQQWLLRNVCFRRNERVGGRDDPNEIYLAQCDLIGFTTLSRQPCWSRRVIPEFPPIKRHLQPAGDGTFVAFASNSTTFVSTPTGGFQQIYLRNTCATVVPNCPPATTMVSVDSSGNALAGNSQLPALSDDARFVVFTTQLANSTVYLRDTCGALWPIFEVPNCIPSTTAISVAADGSTGQMDPAIRAVSPSAAMIALWLSTPWRPTLFLAGNQPGQVFVRNTCTTSSGAVSGCTPSTTLLSVNNGVLTGGSNAAISDDGHFVAYQSAAAGVQQIFFAYTGFEFVLSARVEVAYRRPDDARYVRRIVVAAVVNRTGASAVTVTGTFSAGSVTVAHSEKFTLIVK